MLAETLKFKDSTFLFISIVILSVAQFFKSALFVNWINDQTSNLIIPVQVGVGSFFFKLR